MILRPDLLFRFLKWKLIHLLPRHDVTVDTAGGLLTCSSKDWLIGKYLYVYRSYETENIRATIELLKSEGYLSRSEGGTVLDVGANIGMICTALLKQKYFEKAVAFEPEPDNFRLLVNNVRQNDLEDQVTCFNCGLSAESGEADLELSPHNSGDNNIRSGNGYEFFDEGARTTVKIPVKTLDEVFDESPTLQPENISLVWLDIQGHEGYFFQGARKVLSNNIPVASEIWPYGIKRAGMSLAAYRQVVGDVFTHFYHIGGGHPPRNTPIAEIDRLFEIYDAPRSFGQVVFVNERERG